jgi:threonine dehydrogenase-like Zn-dependent dehydrogenase
MAMREQAQPELAGGEVLVKVIYAGICGSELSGYLGHNALRVPPLVMGHEFAGEIVALGPDARAHNAALYEGQQVTVNPLAYCGRCEYCQRGLNQLCLSRQLIGAHRPGAYAEFVTAPAENVLPLPGDLSPRLGALTEPVAVAVRIAELAGSVAREDVFIAGAGPIGLLALQTLQAKGTRRVFVSDLEPARLAMIEALGGEPVDAHNSDVVTSVRSATDGRGVAVSVEAVGAAITREHCLKATRTAGMVILTGLHEETSALHVSDVIRRELTLRGSFSYSPQNFADALERLASGDIRLDPWIVVAPLAEGGIWFERLIDEPGAVAKVLLVP